MCDQRNNMPGGILSFDLSGLKSDVVDGKKSATSSGDFKAPTTRIPVRCLACRKIYEIESTIVRRMLIYYQNFKSILSARREQSRAEGLHLGSINDTESASAHTKQVYLNDPLEPVPVPESKCIENLISPDYTTASSTSSCSSSFSIISREECSANDSNLPQSLSPQHDDLHFDDDHFVDIGTEPGHENIYKLPLAATIAAFKQQANVASKKESTKHEPETSVTEPVPLPKFSEDLLCEICSERELWRSNVLNFDFNYSVAMQKLDSYLKEHPEMMILKENWVITTNECALTPETGHYLPVNQKNIECSACREIQEIESTIARFQLVKFHDIVLPHVVQSMILPVGFHLRLNKDVEPTPVHTKQESPNDPLESRPVSVSKGIENLPSPDHTAAARRSSSSSDISVISLEQCLEYDSDVSQFYVPEIGDLDLNKIVTGHEQVSKMPSLMPRTTVEQQANVTRKKETTNNQSGACAMKPAPEPEYNEDLPCKMCSEREFWKRDFLKSEYSVALQRLYRSLRNPGVPIRYVHHQSDPNKIVATPKIGHNPHAETEKMSVMERPHYYIPYTRISDSYTNFHEVYSVRGLLLPDLPDHVTPPLVEDLEEREETATLNI